MAGSRRRCSYVCLWNVRGSDFPTERLTNTTRIISNQMTVDAVVPVGRATPTSHSNRPASCSSLTESVYKPNAFDNSVFYNFHSKETNHFLSLCIVPSNPLIDLRTHTSANNHSTYTNAQRFPSKVAQRNIT